MISTLHSSEVNRRELAWLERRSRWCERNHFGFRDAGNGTLVALSVSQPDDLHQVFNHPNPTTLSMHEEAMRVLKRMHGMVHQGGESVRGYFLLNGLEELKYQRKEAFKEEG